MNRTSVVHFFWVALLSSAFLPHGNSAAEEVLLPFVGPGWELSACATAGTSLFLADDELVGAVFFCPDVEKPTECRMIKLETEEDSKLLAIQDFEALAAEEDTLYLLGSHNGKLKKKGPKRRWDREFLIQAEIDWKENPADTELKVSKKRHVRRDLVDLLENHLGLSGAYHQLNFEGLALCGGQLYLGLRSPRTAEGDKAMVLAAPVADWFEKEMPALPKVLAFDLDGQGVRGMSCEAGEILILSGPVKDGPEAHRLHRCNPETQSCETILTLQQRAGLAPEGLCPLGNGLYLIANDADDGKGSSVMRVQAP